MIEPTRVSRIVPAHLDQDALSIVVFGPGRGEAIVVRLPDGRVGVVDGCCDPSDHDTGAGDPVRELLNEMAEMSEDPRSFRLAFVCLTHPHDDHYAGLASLLQAYRGRVDGIWTVAPISGRYMDVLPVQLKALRAGKPIARGDDEPRRLRDVLLEIDRAADDEPDRFCFLSSQKPLARRAQVAGADLEIVAWAPVDIDERRTIDALKRALKRTAGEGHPAHDPNVMSGAVLIEWGRGRVLLAGDLLCGAGQYRGWDGVVEHVSGPVQVVNVAHHASEEAHHDRLWEKLKPELAIVTPFQKAIGRQPPRPEQLKKLLGSTTVAITSPPSWVGTVASPRPSSVRRKPRSSFRGALDFAPAPGRADIHNAVGVSLDATGQITRFVLGGAADTYVE